MTISNGKLKQYRKTIIAIQQAIDELAELATADLELYELAARQQQFAKLHEVKNDLEADVLYLQKEDADNEELERRANLGPVATARSRQSD